MTAMFACVGAFMWLLTAIAVQYLFIGVLTTQYGMREARNGGERMLFILFWPAAYVVISVYGVARAFRDWRYGRYIRGQDHTVNPVSAPLNRRKKWNDK